MALCTEVFWRCVEINYPKSRSAGDRCYDVYNNKFASRNVCMMWRWWNTRLDDRYENGRVTALAELWLDRPVMADRGRLPRCAVMVFDLFVVLTLTLWLCTINFRGVPSQNDLPRWPKDGRWHIFRWRHWLAGVVYDKTSCDAVYFDVQVSLRLHLLFFAKHRPRPHRFHPRSAAKSAVQLWTAGRSSAHCDTSHDRPDLKIDHRRVFCCVRRTCVHVCVIILLSTARLLSDVFTSCEFVIPFRIGICRWIFYLILLQSSDVCQSTACRYYEYSIFHRSDCR